MYDDGNNLKGVLEFTLFIQEYKLDFGAFRNVMKTACVYLNSKIDWRFKITSNQVNEAEICK